MASGRQTHRFSGNEPGHGMRIYVRDLAGGAARPISKEGAPGPVRPSPDGKTVAFCCLPDAAWALVSVDGGEPRSIPGLEKGDGVIR